MLNKFIISAIALFVAFANNFTNAAPSNPLFSFENACLVNGLPFMYKYTSDFNNNDIAMLSYQYITKTGVMRQVILVGDAYDKLNVSSDYKFPCIPCPTNNLK